MKPRIDIVTVYHNDTNFKQCAQLFDSIRSHEPDGGYRLIAVDNRRVNRGFARGCNVGAFHPEADAAVIGFLNPDVAVGGPFITPVLNALTGNVVITGCRFGKPKLELRQWGVLDWVCGAAMFVNRRWFDSVGGFDEQFVWSWEETDLIRQAERLGKHCKSIDLPLGHTSPGANSETDLAYKSHHFALGAKLFRKKWGG